MIRIEVRSKSDTVDGETARFIEHRISFALDRLRDLRRIFVFVEDVNGPKGGADKRCRIVAEFAFASVFAEVTQTTWQSAIAHAIHRIARSAARNLHRLNRRPMHSRRRTFFTSPALELDSDRANEVAHPAIQPEN